MGIQNCGTCHKCVRMMVTLDLLDLKSCYQNFSTPLTFLSYFRWGLSGHVSPRQVKDLRIRAFKKGRINIVLGVLLAWHLNKAVRFTKVFLKKLFTDAALYRLKKKIYQRTSDD